MRNKAGIKEIEIIIDGKHSYGVNLQTRLKDHIIVAKLHTALMTAIPVELPVKPACENCKLEDDCSIRKILSGETAKTFSCNRYVSKSV